VLQDLELTITADLKHVTFSCVRLHMPREFAGFFFLGGKNPQLAQCCSIFILFFFSLGLLPICALAMGPLVFLKPKTTSSVGLMWSRRTSYIRGGVYPSLV